MSDDVLFDEIDALVNLTNIQQTVVLDPIDGTSAGAVNIPKKLVSTKQSGARHLSCELNVIRAKNIWKPDNGLVITECGELFAGKILTSFIFTMPYLSSYYRNKTIFFYLSLVILFNGVEIGRTSTDRSKSRSPKWEEELYTIHIPNGQSDAAIGIALTSTLSIEIHELYLNGRSEGIGNVTITGKSLLSLLSGKEINQKWFDLFSTVATGKSSSIVTKAYV